jgi:hypothetical protein
VPAKYQLTTIGRNTNPSVNHASFSITANTSPSSPYIILPSINKLKRHAPQPLVAPKGLISTSCTLPSGCSATSKLKLYVNNRFPRLPSSFAPIYATASLSVPRAPSETQSATCWTEEMVWWLKCRVLLVLSYRAEPEVVDVRFVNATRSGRRHKHAELFCWIHFVVLRI